MPSQKKYVSPQQEMENLSASLSEFFAKALVSEPGPMAILKKKKQAERLQDLIKKNGCGTPSAH